MNEIMSMCELEATTVELLPSRETLAFLNIANVTAVNMAIAVNAASIGAAKPMRMGTAETTASRTTARL